MLRVEGIRKSYGDVDALRGVDLTVERGQIVALLGRNGAGKTTLVSVMSGLLKPDAGAVSVDDINVLTHPAEAAKMIGLAPQETGIYRVLTVRENLEFFGELAGLRRRESRARGDLVAEQLELTDLMGRKASQLSGGEARRLHTACALVHSPEFLMLDEPTVGADVASRQRLIETVAAMAADGAAVIYTTHYLAEVEALDADIVMIHNGEIMTRGTRAELIEQHHRGGLRFTVHGSVDQTILDDLDIVSVQPQTSGTAGEDVADYVIAGDLRMPDLIDRFGPSVGQLVSVERNLPDLEGVFLAVTGETVSDGEEGL